MDLRDAFVLAGTGLWTHKLRSLLATIGVVLGIASVIAVVTLGAGLQESIVGDFTSEFDADLVSVSLEVEGSNQGPPTFATVLAFTERDVGNIRSLPGLEDVGSDAELRGVDASYGNRSIQGLQVFAHAGANFFDLEEGRLPLAADEVMVNNQTASRLAGFIEGPVMGTILTVHLPNEEAPRNVTIVGIEESSAFQPRATLTLPASYAPTIRYQGNTTVAWQSLTLDVEDAAQVDEVVDSVRRYLETESDARELKGEELTFRFDTQGAIVDLITTSVNQFTAFIGALGAVALLVGLVGIANIMLVSVQERTREIGVMKATGATQRDVLTLFLTESVAICTVGAILGIGLGILMGIGLGAVMVGFFGGEALPFVPVPSWYAIAVVLGVLVGVLAGLYPAWRAARVDPVEALRYE